MQTYDFSNSSNAMVLLDHADTQVVPEDKFVFQVDWLGATSRVACQHCPKHGEWEVWVAHCKHSKGEAFHKWVVQGNLHYTASRICSIPITSSNILPFKGGQLQLSSLTAALLPEQLDSIAIAIAEIKSHMLAFYSTFDPFTAYDDHPYKDQDLILSCMHNHLLWDILVSSKFQVFCIFLGIDLNWQGQLDLQSMEGVRSKTV